MAQISTITRYYSISSGSNWTAETQTGRQINGKNGANRYCFVFTYTPTSGKKLKSLEVSPSLMGITGYYNYNPLHAELNIGDRPNENIIAAAEASQTLTTTNYASTTFTLNIDDSITLDKTTQLCVRFYTNDSPVTIAPWGGVEVASEETSATSVYFDDVLKYTFEDMSDSNKITSSQLPTRADEVGKSFKGWSNNQFTPAEVGAAWNTLQISGQTDIFLYADWIYEDVLIDGEILADISNKIKTLKGKTRATEYTPEELVIALQELIDT